MATTKSHLWTWSNVKRVHIKNCKSIRTLCIYRVLVGCLSELFKSGICIPLPPSTAYPFIHYPSGYRAEFLYFNWQFFPHPSSLTSNVICSPITPKRLLLRSYRGHITACPLQKWNDGMMVSGGSRAYSLSARQELMRHHGPISHYKLTYSQCHFNPSKTIQYGISL